MFAGSFTHTVDDKNRISIPASFRIGINGRCVITKGPDGCIWLLPSPQWDMLLEKSMTSPAIQRFFVASAREYIVTQRRRCLIPDDLRKHADIKPGDEVTIVGLGNRIEIWSSRRWDAVCSQLSSERLKQELPELLC